MTADRDGERTRSDSGRLDRIRRWKRRLKAVAAIGLGLVAGTFVACHAAVTGAPARTPPPSPVDIDAGTDAGAADAAVDHDEHRTGMPVHDNLVE